MHASLGGSEIIDQYSGNASGSVRHHRSPSGVLLPVRTPDYPLLIICLLRYQSYQHSSCIYHKRSNDLTAVVNLTFMKLPSVLATNAYLPEHLLAPYWQSWASSHPQDVPDYPVSSLGYYTRTLHKLWTSSLKILWSFAPGTQECPFELYYMYV